MPRKRKRSKTWKAGDRWASIGHWMNKIELVLYEEQYQIIKREVGKRAADMANYGWGVFADKGLLDVATKVYTHGVLRSTVEYPDTKIRHEWEDYGVDD